MNGFKQKLVQKIDRWQNRPLAGQHAYVFFDRIEFRQQGKNSARNMDFLVAIGIKSDGFHEVLGVIQSDSKLPVAWQDFLHDLKQRGLTGVRLCVANRWPGFLEGVAEYFPEATYQRCVVSFYRHVWSLSPTTRASAITTMLRSVHACGNLEAAQSQGVQVVARLRQLRLEAAAKFVSENIGQTFSYYAFPGEHHRTLRSGDAVSRLLRSMRRRLQNTEVPLDDSSSTILVIALLRYLVRMQWANGRCVNRDPLLPPASAN